MKVLVTGGTGIVGKSAVDRLLRGGWDVRVVGRREGVEVPGAEYAVCDVTRFEAVREQVRGCDAVVHLAALARPTIAPAPEVFGANVRGTFNVFEAAAAEGIRRVVQASSINAFGCAWSLVDLRVEYLPIDEEHPTYTTDPYSFSKNVIEQIGDYYHRRDGIDSVALRLPWVQPQRFLESPDRRRRLRQTRAVLDELAAEPAEKRRARIAEARRRTLEVRAGRPMEYTEGPRRRGHREFGEDRLLETYFSGRFNFWAAVDERDSAQAIEKGLTADYQGSEAVFINDKTNWLAYDAATLAEWFFPEATARRKPLVGADTLVSIDKARAMIGFEPEHSIVAGLEGGG